MSDFKRGDRIVAVEGSPTGLFKEGDKGVVLSGEERQLIRVEMDKIPGKYLTLREYWFEHTEQKPVSRDTGSYTIKASGECLIDYSRIYNETMSPEVSVARIRGPEGYCLMVRKDILIHAYYRVGGEDLRNFLKGKVYTGWHRPLFMPLPEWGKLYAAVKELQAAPLKPEFKQDIEIVVETFGK